MKSSNASSIILPVKPGDGGTPAFSHSERRILGRIFRYGASSQAVISEATELTQQSVSRIVGKLTQQGLLRAGDRVAEGRRGYPSTTFTIAADYVHSFGISITTDSVSLAVLDFAGRTVHEQKQAFSAMTLAPVMDWICDAVSACARDTLPQGAGFAGAGIGIPGSFIGEGHGFNTPHMLEEWAGIDIERMLSDRLGLPVWADNDGNVAALGESLVGAGRWARNFAYLYSAAGVGGGVILDGELWRGRHGNAGEFAGGLPPNIYPFPNLELLRQLFARSGHAFATVNDMIRDFDAHSPAVDDWIARVRDSFSIIASNATAILDLDAIVLGGRMPRILAERVIPHIELFDQKRRAIPRPTAQLVASEASGDAAAIGAALLPLKQQFFAKS